MTSEVDGDAPGSTPVAPTTHTVEEVVRKQLSDAHQLTLELPPSPVLSGEVPLAEWSSTDSAAMLLHLARAVVPDGQGSRGKSGKCCAVRLLRLSIGLRRHREIPFENRNCGFVRMLFLEIGDAIRGLLRATTA